MAFTCKFPQSARKMARNAGLEAERDANGDWRIFSPKNRAFVYVARTEKEAKDYLKDVINTNGPDLDGNVPFPTGGTPIQPTEIKNQGILGKAWEKIHETGRGFVHGSTIAAPFFASIKGVAQSFETAGFGNAFTKIYNPSQFAKGLSDQAIALVERVAFKGRTFQQMFKDIDKRALNFTAEEREAATLYSEAYSRQEVEKLLNMSELDKQASAVIRKLGQEHNLPKLLRLNAIIDDFIKNQEDFVTKKLPLIKNAVLEKQLPEDILLKMRELEASVDPNIRTPDDVIPLMDLTEEEIQALTSIREFATKLQVDPRTGKEIAGKRLYNLPAIYRHATAKELRAGFRNGRDQFAADHQMSAELRQLAEDRIAVLDEAFKEFVPGHSRELTMGVQLPVFRQFIDVGLMPGKSFKGTAVGPARVYAEVLDDFVEGSDIFTRRVLSGHLNPHELDPAVSLSKHVRNLSLRDTLDKEMPGLLKEVGKMTDESAKKIMLNYLHELQGVPTEGMQNLTAMMRRVARYAGVGLDDRIAEKFINNLTALSYTASIPFRLALIARNYYQATLSIPIVGPKAWLHGMSAVTGSGREAAWEAAYKAQALRPDVVPLHGGDSIGDTASRFLPESINSKLPKGIRKIGYGVKGLTEKAFSAYRSADDVGRVLQFEAGRYRAQEAINKFRKGALDLDDAMIDGKVMTFDETIQEEFRRLVTNGQDQAAADMMGKELADRVHFLYGNVNHPVGWGGVAGKLLGQFGTFPVQYVGHLSQGMTNGTVLDRAQFIAYHSALNAGIVAAGSELFGADLESWAFLPSVQYTGGPFAELSLSALAIWGGSEAEKRLARRNLEYMMPSFEHPSIFVPYSYFWNDMAKSWSEEDSIGRMFARATGVRFLQPGQDVEYGFGWVKEILTPEPE